MADWDKIESSGNVEDRRGSSGIVGGVGTLGTIAIVGLYLLFGGGDSNQIEGLLNQIQESQVTTSQGEFIDTRNYKGFVEKVIGSNNEVWTAEIAKQNVIYKEPKLVLFRGATQSGCGGATSEVGPHYCPVDETIYLDETFFEELTSRFGAKGGDVAEAYVMAHEVGHHIQKVKGTFANVDTRNNENSIKVELQADCYAGVWAGTVASEGIINEGEISQAIDAAESVGDDRIQKSAGSRVNPETWTHGSAADRKQWFLTGYKSQDSTTCNTIS
jgi:uncharacterized protein